MLWVIWSSVVGALPVNPPTPTVWPFVRSTLDNEICEIPLAKPVRDLILLVWPGQRSCIKTFKSQSPHRCLKKNKAIHQLSTSQAQSFDVNVAREESLSRRATAMLGSLGNLETRPAGQNSGPLQKAIEESLVRLIPTIRSDEPTPN